MATLSMDVSELLVQLPAATDADPVLQADAEQCLEKFTHALGKLSPRIRATFVLHRHYGMTLREISHELNISFPMAKKYLSKALHEVRRHLGTGE